MAGINQVSFTSPYAADESAIAYRRKLAEMLAKDAIEPIQTNRMAGRFVVPISPWEGAAKLAKGIGSGLSQREAEDRHRELIKQIGGDASKWAQSAPQGVPAQIQDTSQEGTGSMDMSGAVGPANTPAQPPSQQAQMAHLMQGLQNPRTAPVAQMQLAQLMKSQEAYTLPEGAQRRGPGGVIAENPKDFRPEKPEKPGDKWSEPYQMGGVWVQKNETNGQIRTAVTREPQVRVSVPQPVTSIVVQDKTSPTGWSYKDARTGRVTSTGAPAPSGSSEREDVKSAGAQKRATQEDQRAVTNALKAAGYDPTSGKDKIEELIGQATSGGLQNIGATGAAFMGVTTKGREATNTLNAAANRIVLEMMNRKLGAGISNADRDFIVGQLGDVGNPNKTSDERLAAWRFARSRMIDVGMLPTTGGGAQPPTPPGQPRIVDW